MLKPFKDHKNHCQIRSLIEHGHLNTLPFTGHSFIGLTDENGREERWGYTTKADVAGVIETIRGIEGNFISENANQQYNEAIVYPVSRDQYLAAKQKTEEYRQNPGTYKLFEKNCSTVARDILAVAKVDELPGKGLGLTPYGLAAKSASLWLSAAARLPFLKLKMPYALCSDRKKCRAGNYWIPCARNRFPFRLKRQCAPPENSR